jgi:lysophospholipase L1-like esterase
VRVWPLGDSLTVGGYGDQNGFTDSYRYALYRQLGGASNVTFKGHLGLNGQPWGGVLPDAQTNDFSHSGTGGANIAATSGTIESVSGAVQPDVIVLNIGTNGGTPAQYQQLVARLGQLAPNAWIVMGTLTPLAVEVQTRQPFGDRGALNTTIRNLGNASSSDRLLTADVFNRLLNEQGFGAADLWDGTHMTISGGTKFANALAPEVAQAVSAARRC